MNKKYNHISNWEKIYSLMPSGYIRKGTLQVFHKIKRNYPDDYIVCIGYVRGDTQFALTETFKTYETSVEQVIDRCLKEECSVERIHSASSLISTASSPSCSVRCTRTVSRCEVGRFLPT